MSKVPWLVALIGLLLVPEAGAQNPDDIEFRADLVKKSAAFHPGERIEVEVSYASSAEKKYVHTWVAPQPFFGGVEVEVEVSPREGLTDLRELVRGWAGSIAGSEDFLSQKPRVQQFELNQWFRFDKPGHFVLTLKSTAVSRRKTEEEGGGIERMTLESEPLTFDILPRDPAWATAELNEIEGILEQAPAESMERSAAMHRLSLLDSPGAVRKLAEIYLAGPEADRSGDAYRGLNNSGQESVVIALLKEAMSDPARNPHAIGADLLAELEVRQKMGTIPPQRPEDPERQKEWQDKLKQRNDAYNEYFAQANKLILASLKQRTGKARAEATYRAWNNAERQNAGKATTAGVEALRSEVLETASDLEIGEQLNFASSAWGSVPHEQLRPIIDRLIGSDGEEARFMRSQGYEFLCRDWRKDCATAILTAAQEPGGQIDHNVILLLPEAEHPELDALLDAELRGVRPPGDSQGNLWLSALVLRAGSKKLVKPVQEFLDGLKPDYGCEIQAELIGYLFRFSPQDAAKRTLAETLDENRTCGNTIFRTLGRERYSDELVPLAEEMVNSANLDAAGTAALFLAQHGSAADEEKLRSRLEKLRKTWSERAAEVRAAESVRLIAENQTALQAANLEQALVSALVAGANWKLTDEEREALRAGCLTENCRAMAEGKMSLGF